MQHQYLGQVIREYATIKFNNNFSELNEILKYDYQHLLNLLREQVPYTDKEIDDICQALEVSRSTLIEIANESTTDTQEEPPVDETKWSMVMCLFEALLTPLSEEIKAKAHKDFDYFLDREDQNYHEAFMRVISGIGGKSPIYFNVDWKNYSIDTLERLQALVATWSIQDRFEYSYEDDSPQTQERIVAAFVAWIGERGFDLVSYNGSDEHNGFLCPKESSKKVLDAFERIGLRMEVLGKK